MIISPFGTMRLHAMRAVTSAAVLCLAVSAVQAHPRAHTHGLLRLDVAIDPQSITLQFESPLDNFLGFERAPRTDAERRKVGEMVAALKSADGLFYVDPDAGCRVSSVQLDSAALGLGKNAQAAAGKAPERDGHADIDATIVFSCAKAETARFITVKLFEKYPHLQTIDAQVATAQGQFKRSLKPDAPKLDLEQ